MLAGHFKGKQGVGDCLEGAVAEGSPGDCDEQQDVIAQRADEKQAESGKRYQTGDDGVGVEVLRLDARVDEQHGEQRSACVDAAYKTQSDA